MPPESQLARQVRTIAAVTAALFLLPTSLFAQQLRLSEYQVKAAYLYDFTRFITWPPQASNDKRPIFAICVIGKDPFGPILDATLAGEKSGIYKLVARRVSDPEEALACRILFIGESETDHLKEILAEMNRASVLTVSDIPQFSKRGGMIEFVLKGDKVRFDVNLTNAMNAGLRLSSDLLKVALSVKRNPPPGD